MADFSFTDNTTAESHKNPSKSSDSASSDFFRIENILDKEDIKSIENDIALILKMMYPAADEASQENEPEKDNDSDEPALPKLSLPAPVCDFKNGISIFGFSQQGESHIKNKKPCQDRCALRFIGESTVIAAVADGVGSCALSDIGADTAVNSSLDFLEENLREAAEKDFSPEPKDMGRLLRAAMQHAYDSVQKRADELNQLLYSFQSTLTIAVYNGSTIYFAHAGDDGIVAINRDGVYEMITARHKGEEASSVYPLQNTDTWQFGMCENAVAFVMCTDGVLDSFVRSAFEMNRVYFPFLGPAFYSESKSLEDVERICSDWFGYLKGENGFGASYRDRVTDDITLVCVVNETEIEKSVKPSFDTGEWNRRSEEYAKKRLDALYPDRSTYTKKLEPRPAEATAEQKAASDEGAKQTNEDPSAEQEADSPEDLSSEGEPPKQNTEEAHRSLYTSAKKAAANLMGNAGKRLVSLAENLSAPSRKKPPSALSEDEPKADSPADENPADK